MQSRLNDYYITVSDEHLSLAVYWFRSVLGEKESLLVANSRHRFFELHYVLSGALTMRLEGEERKLSAGMLIMLPPRCVHEITWADEGTEKLVFGFDAQAKTDAVARRLWRVDGQCARETKALRALADILLHTEHEDTDLRAIQIRCLTEAFFLEALSLLVPGDPEAAPPPTEKKACSNRELSDRLQKAIAEGVRGGCATVSWLADRLYISRRQLLRFCQEKYGKTPSQMIEDEKLNFIREILATTDHTLSEIAFITGFSSEHSLIRFFREREGFTPHVYRKNATL